jgi:tryptophan synthase alpha chain
MGYMNTVLQYGFEKFCEDAASVGIDGLILPDLPVHEFEKMYKEVIKKYGLDFIFLVTPETSNERVKMLDSMSSGFLYAVSSSSTTGKDKQFGDISKYLKKLNGLQLSNPLLVGFGIKDKHTFDAVQEYTNGAIIGTAFISAIEHSSDLKKDITSFIQNVLA